MLFKHRWMMVVVSLLVILGAFFGATVAAYFLGGLAESWFAGGAHLTNILILVLVFVMIMASLLTAAERKWSAMMQNRIGPNRARIALPGLKNNSLGGIPHFLADGAKMLEMFPVVPLARNQAVSIGVTSYDGGVYFGLNADRSAMPDVDILARMVEESVEELLATVPG